MSRKTGFGIRDISFSLRKSLGTLPRTIAFIAYTKIVKSFRGLILYLVDFESPNSDWGFEIWAANKVHQKHEAPKPRSSSYAESG
jgi:hypothetical protein